MTPSPTHRAWRKVRAWVRERQRYYANAAKRNPGVFGREADRISAERFQAMLLVMDAEMRAQRRKR